MRALLKANAKENLRGNWGTAILVLLIAHVCCRRPPWWSPWAN